MTMNGKVAHADLGGAEGGLLGGHDQVAGERQSESAGEHVAAGGADARLLSAPISVKSRGSASVPKCLCTSGTSAANPWRLAPEEKTVGCEEASTTQRTPSSSRARSKPSISAPEHLRGERVARVRVVQRERCDAALAELVGDMRRRRHGRIVTPPAIR